MIITVGFAQKISNSKYKIQTAQNTFLRRTKF